MPKHDERHLTTIQLSALLDNQLSEQELSMCDAHLQTCSQCQGALAGLKQTVGFVQALPEPVLPRSFVLPVGVAYLQERPGSQGQGGSGAAVRQSRRLWNNSVRRTLRAASTIAAVIGLLILVSGLLPMLMHSGGGFSASTVAAPMSKNAPPFGAEVTSANRTATAEGKGIKGNRQGTSSTTPRVGSTPAAVPTPPEDRAHSNSGGNTQSGPLVPLPDLSTPLGWQEVGFLLFVLGVIGALLTRRKEKGSKASN